MNTFSRLLFRTATHQTTSLRHTIILSTTTRKMTTGSFRYLDPASLSESVKPWAKVDTDVTSYTRTTRQRPVSDLRSASALFSSPPKSFGTDVDVSGFAVYHHPSVTQESEFFTASADAVRGPRDGGYYSEVEQLLRAKIRGIKKVVIFDHTIRRHDKSSPRQPVQQVHVDQTPGAAAARVRRHLPPGEATEQLLQGRYQIINVWRPIGHPATDFPLAVIDWRTISPSDLVAVDLLYPLRNREGGDNEDRGKEILPDPDKAASTEGYEVKGETYGILPNDAHRLYYVKDMTPEEVMFIKCFDSRSQYVPGGRQGVAACTPHTAFVDPQTPEGTKGRQSIEVRCLVFYEDSE
ncbi:hypothetical protein QBC46DRAFT_395127 [Diplogelasinospora grovesii]|uniref:Aspirochlorine biosynthesis protein N n=1 Tax=Diplogelasinospora grovesii TaxID=303347 RepID=A0AAN6MZJ0_9PEZI|nr:hypothetical protein QBC46DRAFT_395127 [Diplogelasinospora grovesii]